jgi:hypothetical protein
VLGTSGRIRPSPSPRALSHATGERVAVRPGEGVAASASKVPRTFQYLLMKIERTWNVRHQSGLEASKQQFHSKLDISRNTH